MGSMNGLVLERVTGGGSKRRLSWHTKDQSRPPFEFFLKAASDSDVEAKDEAASDPKDPSSETSLGKRSSSELDTPLIDLSDLPESAGRTPIPLRDSEHASQVHRKNWKRRRSPEN